MPPSHLVGLINWSILMLVKIKEINVSFEHPLIYATCNVYRTEPSFFPLFRSLIHI